MDNGFSQTSGNHMVKEEKHDNPVPTCSGCGIELSRKESIARGLCDVCYKEEKGGKNA